MSLEPQTRRPAEKWKHPLASELVGGVDLTQKALRERPDAASLASLIELLGNAEYWIAFDVASFEPLLAKCPSPLRELGVGVALRYAEGVDGLISRADLDRARPLLLEGLPDDVRAGIEEGFATLERAIIARDASAELEAQGFGPYAPSPGISMTGLRSSGRATISAGDRTLDRDAVLPIGSPIELGATDERGKTLPAPEVESDLGAPLLSRTDEEGARTVVILVPGRYRLRVPGKAEGRAVLAK